ncbi:MAG: rod-binding protein [Proteobacteria bacterium]|nr:rod-binding protein [Pseudomonadota bacterium]MBU1716471.1 rod-binding protein [Pseudomonadota bacterium]
MPLTNLKEINFSADITNKSRNPQNSANVRPDQAKDAKTRKACADFEAIILRQWLTAMRKSVPKGELFKGGYAEEMYQSMQDNALADHLAHGKGMGLGEVLYRQISGQDKLTTGSR